MGQRTVVLELAGDHRLARDLVAGGVFVPGEQLQLGEECALVLRGRDEELLVTANCVWVDGNGTGLQLVGCDAVMKARITQLAQGASGELELVEPAADPELFELAEAVEPAADPELLDLAIEAAAESELLELAPEPEARVDGDPQADTDAQPDDKPGEDRKAVLSVNERLRGLTLVQQLKVAQHGEISERVLLERMYGKNVWEALLRNPRITGPEVARIARMGSLPRPLIEVIVGNGGWLQIPEVRRALLTNPRLGTDQMHRVLRLLPKHELKLAGMQTAYPFAVRDAAKRMLRELGS